MMRLISTICTFVQHSIFRAKGFRFGQNVIVSKRGVCRYGQGGVITLGNNVCINAEVMLVAFKDISIGDNSTIAYRAIISTSANPNAPYNALSRIYKPKYEPVSIGKDCWIGAGAIILPGVKIGNGSVVAAGAVVNKDVPDNVMVAGCPAVIKKKLIMPVE